MKRLTILLAAAAVLTVGTTAVKAEKLDLVSFINSAQQTLNGSAFDTGSRAQGVGVFDFDTETNVLNWEILYTDVLLQGVETMAHIHGPAGPGEEAGILIDLNLGAFKSGSVDITTIPGANASDLLNDQWYVNIHSTAFPGGEIRGQILVPEPSSIALTVLGLTALMFFRRKQK